VAEWTARRFGITHDCSLAVSASMAPTAKISCASVVPGDNGDERQQKALCTMVDQASELTGVWILRSAHLERADTGEKILSYGDNPRGVLILHEGGRMAAIITPSHQSGDAPPPRRKLLAYSGRYRIESGNRFVTDVDIAWLPSWVGTPRGRTFSLRDGELDIMSDPAPVEFLDGAMATGILTWAREDSAAAAGAST
jgi:hypothetical protein